MNDLKCTISILVNAGMEDIFLMAIAESFNCCG